MEGNFERRWITQAEAARLCEVSRQTIRRWVADGIVVFRELPNGRIQIDLVLLEKAMQPK